MKREREGERERERESDRPTHFYFNKIQNKNKMFISVADKLHWTFKLYDKDGSGEIGKP